MTTAINEPQLTIEYGRKGYQVFCSQHRVLKRTPLEDAQEDCAAANVLVIRHIQEVHKSKSFWLAIHRKEGYDHIIHVKEHT